MPLAPLLCTQASGHAGKCFLRTLESHVHLLCNLEVGLALQIVPAPAAGLPGDTRAPVQLAASSTVEDDDDDDGDDEEDAGAASEAEPIVLPPPFDLVLQDATLGVSVGRLHSLLLGPRSPLMAAHYAAEQLSDVVVGPWRAATPPAGALRVRQVRDLAPPAVTSLLVACKAHGLMMLAHALLLLVCPGVLHQEALHPCAAGAQAMPRVGDARAAGQGARRLCGANQLHQRRAQG